MGWLQIPIWEVYNACAAQWRTGDSRDTAVISQLSQRRKQPGYHWITGFYFRLQFPRQRFKKHQSKAEVCLRVDLSMTCSRFSGLCTVTLCIRHSQCVLNLLRKCQDAFGSPGCYLWSSQEDDMDHGGHLVGHVGYMHRGRFYRCLRI